MENGGHTLVKKYRKLPVVIEAIQWTGDNLVEIKKFTKGNIFISSLKSNIIVIKTPEGDMNCKIGYYIIKGVNGEFYPIEGNIFYRTYEEV